MFATVCGTVSREQPSRARPDAPRPVQKTSGTKAKDLQANLGGVVEGGQQNAGGQAANHAWAGLTVVRL